MIFVFVLEGFVMDFLLHFNGNIIANKCIIELICLLFIVKLELGAELRALDYASLSRRTERAIEK